MAALATLRNERKFRCTLAGAVAQLGERLVRNEEVRGSIPLGSTTASPDTVATICLLPETLPDEFGATRPPTRPPVWANARPRASGGASPASVRASQGTDAGKRAAR